MLLSRRVAERWAGDPVTTHDPWTHAESIVLPDGTWIEVGPDLCENPDLRLACNEFHHNIHHSTARRWGPQDGAPGLHDGVGVDLIGRRGCDNSEM